MAIWIQILSGSDKPIYAQIVEQMATAIAKGQIVVGDKLPAVRKLAAELVINPNTVANAYRILERMGLVVTKTGSGTYVSDIKQRSKDASQINILSERMDNLIAQGLNLGIKKEDLIDMFKQRLGKFVQKL
ncbi:MAG: GntR family transcriptional regulator [Sedimentisphaerales bacterium]|nr:GntR family transcriptional regulator [Sedimentisphaerales bacterium]